MDSTVVLLGGEKVAVAKLDGSTEEVFVRLLPLREFPRLLERLEDEPAMAELFCDRPQGWADKLTLESIEQIIERGEKLNGDFFSRWAQRRIARQERIMPGITARLQESALPTGPRK